MVASRKRRTSIGRPHDTGTCETISEILTTTTHREGLQDSLPFIRLGSGLDKDSVQVRLGVRIVAYHITGCTPNQERSSTGAEAVVVECPTEPSERCSKCILNAGAGAVDAYESVVIRSAVRLP